MIVMLVVSLMRLGEEEERLKALFPEVEFEFYKHPSYLPDTSKANMDVLLSYHADIDRTFIEEARNLKWIMWYATGVNALPLECLKENHIALTNAKGVHAQQLTEFLFAYLLDDYKALKETYVEQLNKIYNHKRTTPTIADQTIMFLGTGKIPQSAARIAQQFGMTTIGLNTTGHKADGFHETYPLKDKFKYYHQADIIVNVLPETEKTKYLLTSEDFKQMQPHTLFINLGRGTIVREKVLVDALKNSEIRKAYLDVFETEPLSPHSELYHLKNVVLTSHISGNGNHNKTQATEIFIQNLQHFLNKGTLIENIVDLNKGY